MPSPSLDASLVRILTDNQEPRRPIGAGFLVTPKHILTCAHVVNAALRRNEYAADQPDVEVFFDFPLLKNRSLLRAKILRWFPVQEKSAVGEIEDIAVLEIMPGTSLPEEARPAPVVLPHEQSFFDQRVRMCGFPVGIDNGTYANGTLQGPNAKGWVEIHHQGREQIEAGFSGTAVWSVQENAVYGMTVSILNRQNARVAYMIPAVLLIKAFPELDQHSRPANPFRGLEAFREKDADLYFGRGQTITRLRQVVADRPFAAVIGASGSGKSSVVFAGLIPALHKSGDWLVAHCRPKKEPFYELSACLIPLLYDDPILRSEKIDELKGKLHAGSVGLTGIIRQIRERREQHENQHFLLIVDQFEELFTLNTDQDLIQQYIEILLECLRTEDFTVLLTMRADFFAAAVSSPALAEALDNSAPIILPQIDEQGLREVIEQPATMLGVRFEAGLVDLIVRDVGKEPGSLPLLEFCLTQLWERQEFHRISHAAYTAIGGVQQALANHADAVYAEFDEQEREQLRHIFLKLVRPGQGTEDTRQVAKFGQIAEKYRGLITRLADKRLIVTGRDEEHREETVEVVHEALIRRWQTLRQWVNEEREFLVWQEKLRVLLRQWEDNDHDEGALLRGLPLDETLKWRGTHAGYLADEEREFIGASEQLRERERKERQAAQEAKERQRKKNTSMLVLGLIVAISLSAVAVWQGWKATTEKHNAENNYKQAKSNELAVISARLRDEGDCTLAIRVAQAAYEINPENVPPTAEQALIDSYNKVIMKENFFYQHILNHDNSLNWSMYSPDGHTILTASLDGTAKIWSSNGNHMATLEHNGSPLTKAIFSPDGSRIVTSGRDKLLKIWSAKGELIKDLQEHGCDESSLCQVNNIVFSPDSERMVSVGDDRSVILWDKNGNMLHKETDAHKSFIYVTDFSTDGSRFLTAAPIEGHTIKLWDGYTGKHLLNIVLKKDNYPYNSERCDVLKVLFSADSQRIIAASGYFGIRIFDLHGNVLNNIFDKNHMKKLSELVDLLLNKLHLDI